MDSIRMVGLGGLAMVMLATVHGQAPPTRVPAGTKGFAVRGPAPPPLTAEQARDLEARVSVQAEDLEARGRLLHYYFGNGDVREWGRHELWLVEAHPGSNLHLEFAGPDSPDREVLMERLKAAWGRAVMERPKEVDVLLNAAMFLAAVDAPASLELLNRARTVAPEDRRVLVTLLAKYYQPPGVLAERGPADRVAFSEQAMRELENGRDAELMWMVGRNLIARSTMVPVKEQWRSWGERLVERARVLDPMIAKRWENAPMAMIVSPPIIPDEARRAGVTSGQVRVMMTIGPDGVVREATVVEGDPLLGPTAVGWVKERRYQATGQTVKTEVTVDFVQARGAVSGDVVPAPPRITVGGNVQTAMLVNQVQPVYPPAAMQARIQGTVRFIATLSGAGEVVNLTLVSGHPVLVQAATEAVKQWRYKPTLLNGVPVEVTTQVDVPFTLPQ